MLQRKLQKHFDFDADQCWAVERGERGVAVHAGGVDWRGLDVQEVDCGLSVRRRRRGERRDEGGPEPRNRARTGIRTTRDHRSRCGAARIWVVAPDALRRLVERALGWGRGTFKSLLPLGCLFTW